MELQEGNEDMLLSEFRRVSRGWGRDPPETDYNLFSSGDGLGASIALSHTKEGIQRAGLAFWAPSHLIWLEALAQPSSLPPPSVTGPEAFLCLQL